MATGREAISLVFRDFGTCIGLGSFAPILYACHVSITPIKTLLSSSRIWWYCIATMRSTFDSS